MLSPYPHTEDFSPPVSFTALLIADDIDDDVLPYDLPDQKPIFLPPPPETLESLIPTSLLSSYLADKNRRIPSEELNPRKRALEPIPECSYPFESRQVQIPMLYSPDEAKVMPPRVEIRVPFSQPAPPTLESILNGFSLLSDEGAQIRSTREDKGKRKRQAQVDKNHRRRISEKVCCLGKLIPGEQKMSTATMLEEAYGYIKFLQAQIQALSSMPTRSAYGGFATASHPSGVGGLLGSLSRQQLLQIVVNSPAAQAVLCSDKCCVVSVEQVELLRNMLKQRLSAAGI